MAAHEHEPNAELARRAVDAVLRGDVDAVADLLDPEVKWHGGDPSSPGACVNRAQVLAFIRKGRARRRGVEIVDVVAAGDKVVVIMGPPAEDDGSRAWTIANVTSFRDGKAVEIVHFPDVADALAAAGVAA